LPLAVESDSGCVVENNPQNVLFFALFAHVFPHLGTATAVLDVIEMAVGTLRLLVTHVASKLAG
jgi:hypothetical protein